MSRLFNPATSDFMTYALPAGGSPGPVNWQYGTMLVVAKFNAGTSWTSFIEMTATSVVVSMGRRSTDGLYYSEGVAIQDSSQAGPVGSPFTIGSGDGWCLYAFTKAAGTVSPTFHKIPIGGTRVTHSISATSVDVGAPLDNGTITIGGNDDFFNGRFAALAIMPQVVLSTTQLDAIATAKTTASIVGLAPANGWVVDDSDGFANNLVANNTHRSAIAGTTASADDPAGWIYMGGSFGGPPPSNTVVPAVTGIQKVAQPLSCTTGTWTGTSITYAYQWQRDNSGGGTFSNISGATSNTLALTETDLDCMIRCVVTATDAGGSTSANSNSVGPIDPADPTGPTETVFVWVDDEWVAADQFVWAGDEWFPEP